MAREPTYDVFIDCEDGMYTYSERNLSEVADILKQWCINYILVPEPGRFLDGIWIFHAVEREDNGLSWPEFKDVIINELKGE